MDPNNINNTPDTTNQFDPNDIAQNKVMAILAYIIFLIPLLAAKDSPYARYHTNQGLALIILSVVINVAASILDFVGLSFIGWIIRSVGGLIVLVFAILGIVNANGGKAKQLPIIGGMKLLK